MVPNRELQPASGTTVWEAQRVGRPAQSIIEDTAKWALIQCQVRYMKPDLKLRESPHQLVQDVCHEQFESIESLLLLLLLFWDSDRSKSHSCKIRLIFSSFYWFDQANTTQSAQKDTKSKLEQGRDGIPSTSWIWNSEPILTDFCRKNRLFGSFRSCRSAWLVNIHSGCLTS